MRIIAIALGFMLAGFCLLPLSMAQEIRTEQKVEAKPETETEDQITDRPFISLFHDVRKGYGHISNQATQYVDACCKDRDAAIKMLRDNGFKVKIISDPEEVERINRYYEQYREHWTIDFDEFISGRRGAGWGRFWRLFTSYEVTLFIKDGKVADVYAAVVTTIP